MANYFSIFLVLLTLGSGLIWLLDHFFWAPKRKDAAKLAQQSSDVDIDAAALEKLTRVPSLVDTAQQIFPVIAFVLILRSFLYEPFQIPSGSMMPTLLVGDFILVEKYAYGLKDPVARNKFIDTGSPERGDIVVFKYPLDPNVDYIKRAVGLPGDRIYYHNKQLVIKPACQSTDPTQCEPETKIALTAEENKEFLDGSVWLEKFSEQLGDVDHQILRNPTNFKYAQGYPFVQNGMRPNEWIVPEGHYFMMGDNRDNSQDSRFWGFVPDENLVGKAVCIWISFEFDRAPSSWVPGWIPTGVRFSRIGGIE